jgi:hypothetical protein
VGPGSGHGQLRAACAVLVTVGGESLSSCKLAAQLPLDRNQTNHGLMEEMHSCRGLVSMPGSSHLESRAVSCQWTSKPGLEHPEWMVRLRSQVQTPQYSCASLRRELLKLVLQQASQWPRFLRLLAVGQSTWAQACSSPPVAGLHTLPAIFSGALTPLWTPQLPPSVQRKFKHRTSR